MIKHRFLAANRVAAVLLLLVFPFTTFAADPKLPAVPAGPMNAINPAELKLHLEFLASQEFGGRYTLSPTFKVAARYIATRLENLGLKPAGDNGTYFQNFDLVKTKADPEKSSMTLTLGGQPTQLKFGEFTNALSSGGSAEGNLVFLGYGYSTPDQKYDDYAGIDVKGKIVVVVSGSPKGIDPSLVQDEQEGSGAAAAHGAAGVIVIPSPRYLPSMMRPDWPQLVARYESVRLAKGAVSKIPMVRLHKEVADKLLAQMNTTVEQINAKARAKEEIKPQPLEGSAKFTTAVMQTTVPSQNVVAILEGTDPKLKDEYVAISAHYDHINATADGKINPGADDDGSGTVSVLNIAKALTMQRPKRSILFIWHAGEELGLLGSEYNADIAPVIPLEKIVCDLNIDMIGRSKRPGDTKKENEQLTDANTIYAVGANRISTELHNIHEATNNQYEHLKLDYLLNDPKHPDRIYFRSDHWNYAKHGVPVIFWFDGQHEDYHKPGDTVDKIDWEKMTKVARLVYGTAWRVANLDHRLKIDAKAAKAASN